MATSTTRIFKSGNSLAVRIPKDMTPDEVPEEAQIEWSNGVWTIRPLHRRTLAGLMDRFKAFSPEFMAGGREFHEQKERDWGDLRDDGSPPAKPPSRTDDAERT
jgi:antitoxin VapB